MTLDQILGPGWRDRANQYSYHGQSNMLDSGGAIPMGDVFGNGKQYFIQRDTQTSSADNGYAAPKDDYVLYDSQGDKGGDNYRFDTNTGALRAHDYTPNQMSDLQGALFVAAVAAGGAYAGGGGAGGSVGGASGEGAALGVDGTGIGVGGGEAAGTGLGSVAGGTGGALDATAPTAGTGSTGSGLNPAFDTLGDPGNAGITGSAFEPATTQAPLPMDGSYFAGQGTTTALGPTSGFVAGSPAEAGGLANLGSGLNNAGNAPSTGGLGKAIGGLGSLAQIGGAIQGDNAQKQASNNMLDWLRSQQAKIDGLYQPGSPEYNLLMQQMSAKDAQAGRNSQYGTRSVDLAAKIAQVKAEQTARLTSGIAGNMSSAFNQNASSNAGLNATIGNLTKQDANGNSQLSNGISGLSSLAKYF